jgi:fumarylacetoacetate (FAA) hydrolase
LFPDEDPRRFGGLDSCGRDHRGLKTLIGYEPGGIVKLATLNNGTPDGKLIVVSRDLSRAQAADQAAPTLQAALENWTVVVPRLQALYQQLNVGTASGAFPLNPAALCAPLPRAWQWLDGSAYKAHLDLATRAFGMPNPWHEQPLMYQGMSHQFLSPTEVATFPSEEDWIDFEGEFGVITDAVPYGVSAAAAREHVKLLVQINDWSLRLQGRDEMKRGYGWIHAKPACSVAPVAITPDELGEAWKDARIHLALHIWRNDQLFGSANGGEMGFGFDDLVAHAAYSRALPAGTIVGSGTVANANFKEVGSSCIAERRGIETLDYGAARTPFLHFGDRIRMEARDHSGTAPFGVIDQLVVPASK